MALISEYLAADSSPDASVDALAMINIGSTLSYKTLGLSMKNKNAKVSNLKKMNKVILKAKFHKIMSVDGWIKNTKVCSTIFTYIPEVIRMTMIPESPMKIGRKQEDG